MRAIRLDQALAGFAPAALRISRAPGLEIRHRRLGLHPTPLGTSDAARQKILPYRNFFGSSPSLDLSIHKGGGLSGTGFLDNTVRDIFFALRTFKRAPLAAFTVIATVALGLGLVAVAFAVLNLLLFRVDRVPNVHEMFALERPQSSNGEREPFTRAQFDALRRETSVFTDSF